MKHIICVSFLFYFLLNSYAQNNDISSNHTNTIYDEKIVIEQITKRFNRVNHHYSYRIKAGGSPLSVPFFVYDLIDTTKIFLSNDDVFGVGFIEKHIYYIGAIDVYSRISIIMIPYNGKLFFFEGLNCAKNIHKIEDVLNWIEHNFSEKLDANEMYRIINYQKYNKSIRIDPQGSRSFCEHGKRKNGESNKIKSPTVINLKKK